MRPEDEFESMKVNAPGVKRQTRSRGSPGEIMRVL
jgi:hypothetical protein